MNARIFDSNKYQELYDPPVPSGFPGRNRYLIQVWYLVSALLFNTSPHFMFGWRRFLLRLFGAKIGVGVKLRPSAIITYPWNLNIGDYSYIGDEVVLYSLGCINIGSNVSISYRSFLCTGTHDYKNPSFPLIVLPITVNSQAWLAADVFIAPGVEIGVGAVVGARSSVFSNIPEAEVYAGSPARFKAMRT